MKKVILIIHGALVIKKRRNIKITVSYKMAIGEMMNKPQQPNNCMQRTSHFINAQRGRGNTSLGPLALNYVASSIIDTIDP